MDYSLPALKVLVAQLRPAVLHSPSAHALGGLRFQRIWLQGVVVAGASEERRFLLDDGSGLIELKLPSNAQDQSCQPGMYIMVIGAYLGADADLSVVKVHKIVDLSLSPDREAVWHLEVIEAHNFFYRSKIN